MSFQFVHQEQADDSLDDKGQLDQFQPLQIQSPLRHPVGHHNDLKFQEDRWKQ